MRHSVFVLLCYCLLLLAPVGQTAPGQPTSPITLKSVADASPAEIRKFYSSEDYGNKSDKDFVADLYRGILRREPDPEGYKIWLAALKNKAKDPKARQNAVDAFLKSPEYVGAHPAVTPVAPVVKKKSSKRNPGNVIFDQTGVFINSAASFRAADFAEKLKKAKVSWLTLQIDNGGGVREDNAAEMERGWGDEWRAAGFHVGFWGCPRGVSRHNSQDAVTEAIPLVQADAALGARLTKKYRGQFYIADCEDHYQGYNQTDPAPALNRVYVEAFEKAAKAEGIANIPRALSSMGRVALDMDPWIEGGWDAMPQAYWNSYAVYQPSRCVDFYVREAGWPIERIHPTIATYSGEGENRTVTLQEYAADLKTAGTIGFSFYLPESYLNDAGFEQIGTMSGR